MRQESDRLTLKAYQSPEHPEMKWAVSGPAEGSARRWRKLFMTREEAESFLLQFREENREAVKSSAALPSLGRTPGISLRSEAVRPEKLPPRGDRTEEKRGVEVPKLLGLLLLIGVAFFIDRMVRALLSDPDNGVALAANFEANPLLSGWIASDQGVDWTATEHQSGARSISIQGGHWTSPLLPVQGSSWYRVGFESKGRPQDRRGRVTAIFEDRSGQELCTVTFGGAARMASWQPNEFYVQPPRVEQIPGQSGELQMKLRFFGDPEQPWYVDDVVVLRGASDVVAGDVQPRMATRSGHEAAELLAAGAEFETDPDERPIFGETFRTGSAFELQGMVVDGGEAFGAPEKVWSQLVYEFPQPLDLKTGDLTVYWAFRADRSKGEEAATLHTFLNFTGTPPGDRSEPARLAVRMRNNSFADLYVDPGWEMENLAQCRLIGNDQSVAGSQTVEKFRLRVRLVGRDVVQTDVAWWNRGSRAWEDLASAERSGDDSAVMRLDVVKQLLGHTSFRSLFFQVASDVPKLDTVLITRQPPRNGKAGDSSAKDRDNLAR